MLGSERLFRAAHAIDLTDPEDPTTGLCMAQVRGQVRVQ